jgi:predicted nucleic acid-binding Zn ribbon protein
MTVGGAWGDLVADRGWAPALDVAALHGLWPQIVGPANAEHATPESFDPESGVLVIRTSSTAWAEQLRLMLPALRTAIDAQVGRGVVHDIRLLGPTPPRTRGRLRVRGRGPRDTYG